jgi:hypothetical protein
MVFDALEIPFSRPFASLEFGISEKKTILWPPTEIQNYISKHEV